MKPTLLKPIKLHWGGTCRYGKPLTVSGSADSMVPTPFSSFLLSCHLKYILPPPKALFNSDTRLYANQTTNLGPPRSCLRPHCRPKGAQTLASQEDPWQEGTDRLNARLVYPLPTCMYSYEPAYDMEFEAYAWISFDSNLQEMESDDMIQDTSTTQRPGNLYDYDDKKTCAKLSSV